LLVEQVCFFFYLIKILIYFYFFFSCMYNVVLYFSSLKLLSRLF
jgi:hypothetical protein